MPTVWVQSAAPFMREANDLLESGRLLGFLLFGFVLCRDKLDDFGL